MVIFKFGVFPGIYLTSKVVSSSLVSLEDTLPLFGSPCQQSLLIHNTACLCHIPIEHLHDLQSFNRPTKLPLILVCYWNIEKTRLHCNAIVQTIFFTYPFITSLKLFEKLKKSPTLFWTIWPQIYTIILHAKFNQLLVRLRLVWILHRLLEMLCSRIFLLKYINDS